MFEDEIVVTLSKPVIIGTGDTTITYAELKLREPTAGEIEKASRADTNVGTAITLISLITKIPRGAIEKISRRDLMAADKFLQSFTDAGPSAADGQS